MYFCCMLSNSQFALAITKETHSPVWRVKVCSSEYKMKVSRKVDEYEIFIILHSAFLSKKVCSVGQAVLNRGCTKKHFGLQENINFNAYRK